MKTFLSFVLCLFIVNNLFSQFETPDLNTHVLDGQIWVLDSTHTYQPDLNGEIYLRYRDLVLTRNEDGKVTSDLFLKKSTVEDEWVKSYKSYQSYYDNGIKNENLVQQYDENRNIWIDTVKYVKRNEKGQIIIFDLRYWDSAIWNYRNGDKIYKVYNENGKVVSKLHVRWNKDDKLWVNYVKEMLFYNSNGKKKNGLILKKNFGIIILMDSLPIIKL